MKKKKFSGQQWVWILGIIMVFFNSGSTLWGVAEDTTFNRLEKLEDPAQPKIATRKAHRLEAGDKLRIKIYPEDQYIRGGDTEVSGEGTVTLPLLGKIQVAGLSLTDAEKEITRLLAEDYLVNPVVVIELLTQSEESKLTISVLGQVKKPGPLDYPTDKKPTLLRVISMAGGFSEIANTKKIKIIRKSQGRTQVIHANAESIIAGKDTDIEIEPDDIIHVGESFF